VGATQRGAGHVGRSKHVELEDPKNKYIHIYIYIIYIVYLVGGLEHDFYDFPYIGNVIIPTDELHHFSEG